MADLALDNDGDLDISGAELSIVRDDDALVQHCQIRFRLVKGEWFLDTRVGMPYFEKILVKNPDTVVIGALFRKAILEQPGIVEITRFELEFDSAARQLSLAFTAKKDDGGTLSFAREYIV